MMEYIENILNEVASKDEMSPIIIDGCILSSRMEYPPLMESLYEGMRGLEVAEVKTIEERIVRIEEIKRFIRRKDARRCIALPEVLNEIEMHYELVRNSCNFFKKKGLSRNGENPKRWMRYFKKHVAYNSFNEVQEKLEGLNEYSMRFNSFIDLLYGMMHEKDITKGFDKEQRSLYWEVFDCANYFSSQKEDSSCRKLRELRNPSLIGRRLKTDQKILASAFALARDNLTFIVSSDNGMRDLASRVCASVKFREHRVEEIDESGTIQPKTGVIYLIPSEEGIGVSYFPSIKTTYNHLF